MNRSNRSVLVALLGMSLSGPCWALGEADGYWNVGIAGGKEVAEIAAAWRPQGLKFLPVITNYLDLSQLERKLRELDSNIKMDMSSTKQKSGTGVDCDQQNPPMVNYILIGGNAEKAGIKWGGRITKINGQVTTDYYKQIAEASGDVIEFTLATGATVPVRKQELPALSFDLLNQLVDQSRQCHEALDKLQRQAATASADPRAIVALAAQSRELDMRITQLGDALENEIKRYQGMYHSTAQ